MNFLRNYMRSYIPLYSAYKTWEFYDYVVIDQKSITPLVHRHQHLQNITKSVAYGLFIAVGAPITIPYYHYLALQRVRFALQQDREQASCKLSNAVTDGDYKWFVDSRSSLSHPFIDPFLTFFLRTFCGYHSSQYVVYANRAFYEFYNRSISS
jgi:hypothetical protein